MQVCSIKQFEKFPIKNCNNIEINEEREGGGLFANHEHFSRGRFDPWRN